MSKAAKVLFNGETQFKMIRKKIAELNSDLLGLHLDEVEAIYQILIDCDYDKNKAATLAGFTFVEFINYCQENYILYNK